MKKMSIDRVKPIGFDYSGMSKITDTAGFEPLEAKIKRFMISGEIARLKAEQFDSFDYAQMMNGIPDSPYDPEDDLEELLAKIKIIAKNQAEILARKRAAGKEPEKTPVVSETKKEELEDKPSNDE